MKAAMTSPRLTEAMALPWPEVLAAAPMPEPPPSVLPAEASLEEWVELARQGSQEAFGELVRQHESRLFNFLRQFTGNDHDAQDLAQDTFLKAYRNIGRFQRSGSFSAWLFTIAKRTALNHLRDHRRESTEEPPEQIDFATPAQAFADSEDRAGLWEVARRLKPAQFEALWLRYAEGFSVAETARIMRTNQIRVRVLLHRGRGRLAQWLEASRRGGNGPLTGADSIAGSRPVVLTMAGRCPREFAVISRVARSAVPPTNVNAVVPKRSSPRPPAPWCPPRRFSANASWPTSKPGIRLAPRPCLAGGP